MERSLHDGRGRRKYLLPAEVQQFLRAALRIGGETATYCAVLAFAGARTSEVLKLTAERIDETERTITFRTLKKRGKIVDRTLPVPRELLNYLDAVHHFHAAKLNPATAQARLWEFSRSTAWRRVKQVMAFTSIPSHLRTGRALRHALGAGSRMKGIDIEMIREWLGHTDIKTTAIYSTVVGQEARTLFSRVSQPLTRIIAASTYREP